MKKSIFVRLYTLGVRCTSVSVSVFVIMVAVFTMSCGAESTGSGGEISDYISVATADDLMKLSGTDVKENVKFTADINMKDKDFKGIKSFEGVMDGNGKKITDLTINNATGDAGLILSMDGGEIKNLTIESGTITGDKNVGAFVANASGNITLSGLTNKANVDATSISTTGNSGKAGGIIGFASINITINNALNSGTVKSGDAAGGIIGNIGMQIILPTIINNAKNSGSVEGNVAGGIIGIANSTIIINNAENSGNVASSSNNNSPVAGGIIGWAIADVTINNAGNSGAITGGDAGGIVGMTGTTTIIIDKIYSYSQLPIKGFQFGTITITDNSFYLTGGTGHEDATEIDKAQFKLEKTFTDKGWDFGAVWKMGANHPELQ